MRKNKNEPHKTNSTKRQYFSPKSPPKKEFQLLYRERDNLPFSEAYENIIFLKSKKCDDKTNRSTKNGKNRKHKVHQLKKIINYLERQLKQQSSKQIKNEPNSKSTILKNTGNTQFSQRKEKKQSTNFVSPRKHQQKSKRKADHFSREKARNNRSMLSPSRHMKNKHSKQNISELKPANVEKKSLNKIRKTKKTENSKHLKNQDQNQFILLENEFVAMNNDQYSFCEEKFMENRLTNDFYQVSKLDDEYMRKSDEEEEILKNLQPQFSQRYFYDQNQLKVVEQFFLQKIVRIQRWWKKLLDKRQESSQKITPIEESVQSLSSSRIYNISKIEDTSPIKMIEPFIGHDEVTVLEPSDALQLRDNAAQLQLNTHSDILKKLFETSKISFEVYRQKSEAIKRKFQLEMVEIDQVRSIIKNNNQKAFELVEKTKNDVEKSANLEMNNEQVEEFLNQYQSNINVLSPTEVNALMNTKKENNFVAVRQKSTGCHYTASEDSAQACIYRKEDKDNQDISSEEEKEFYENNLEQSAEITGDSFKQFVNEFKQMEEVKMQIDKRVALQMGIIPSQIEPQLLFEQIHVDTSLTSIHRFLLNFFKFYAFYYKDDFLKFVNMPFGQSLQTRLSKLQGNKINQAVEEDQNGIIYGVEGIISEDALEEFFDKFYQITNSEYNEVQRQNIEFEIIHTKAVFSAFNEAMNQFRPYFAINGTPYPWDYCEKALTFYFIAQENIQEVFEKSQFKVLKWASSLCGINASNLENLQPEDEEPDFDYQSGTVKSKCHPMLQEARDDRIIKNQKAEIYDAKDIWLKTDQEKTFILIEAANFIFDEICRQVGDFCIESNFNINSSFLIKETIEKSEILLEELPERFSQEEL